MTDRSFGLLRTLGSNAHEVFYCKLSTPPLSVVGDHGKPSCNDVYGTSAVVGDVEKPSCTVVGDVDKPSCLGTTSRLKATLWVSSTNPLALIPVPCHRPLRSLRVVGHHGKPSLQSRSTTTMLVKRQFLDTRKKDCGQGGLPSHWCTCRPSSHCVTHGLSLRHVYSQQTACVTCYALMQRGLRIGYVTLPLVHLPTEFTLCDPMLVIVTRNFRASCLCQLLSTEAS